MALIQWRDDFKLGIPSVDHEHAEMIRLINEAHTRIQGDAPARDVEEFLGEVYAHIAAHFALEETVMRQRGYDDYAVHKEDHERLLDGLRDIMDRYEAGDFQGLTEELSLRLRDWFVEHFKNRDARLHKNLGVF